MDTLVIGIDGGEWDVLTPLLEAGDLPNIAELKDDGCSGELESITPPVSPPAWNTIQTGTNPGKHGVFDFSTFDERYQRRSVNATDRRATPFWQVLNDHGVSTGLFKVPFTYPPDDVDGFMVTGFPTPNSVTDFAKPASLTDRFEGPKELFEDWSLQHDGKYEAFRDDLIAVAEDQTDFLLEFVADYDVDFLMTVYDGADRIQHFFWKYFDEDHARYIQDSELADAIPAYYRTVDAAIGRILDEIDGDPNIVLLSDHGFGPLEKDVYIEEVLEEEGFLVRTDQTQSRALMSKGLREVVRHSWAAVKRVGLDRTVKRFIPEDLVLAGREIKEARRTDVDWEATEAFFTTLSGQAILINLEDRFSQGAVPTEEYDEVVDDLRTTLLDLTDPKTDEPVVRDVHHRDEVFDGWAIKDAPDLVVECEPEYTLKGGRSDQVVAPATQHAHERSGDHRSNGIVIATGPDFENGPAPEMSVLDVAPTLLSLHDVPVPESMDGEVHKGLFTEDSRADGVEYTSHYGQEMTESRRWTESEEAEVEARLEDMGYLN